MRFRAKGLRECSSIHSGMRSGVCGSGPLGLDFFVLKVCGMLSLVRS